MKQPGSFFDAILAIGLPTISSATGRSPAPDGLGAYRGLMSYFVVATFKPMAAYVTFWAAISTADRLLFDFVGD